MAEYLDIIQSVFNTWATALADTDIGERAYMERPAEDIVFPCASLLPMPSPETGYDLANQASGIELHLQVDIFVRSTAPLSKLYELQAVSHEALCGLGFRMTTQASPEMPQSGYKRLITRYSRVIGYSETITTFTED